MVFLGTYECKIDEKARLRLPLSLLSEMEHSADARFVLKRSLFQDCLEVYPFSSWERLMSKVNGLNRFVKENADFIRVFTAGVKVFKIDGAGRLQISRELVRHSSLKKNVVIAGAGECFEIWDAERYELAISISGKDFSSLAQRVMGSIN